jgi:hypothetical protein
MVNFWSSGIDCSQSWFPEWPEERWGWDRWQTLIPFVQQGHGGRYPDHLASTTHPTPTECMYFDHHGTESPYVANNYPPGQESLFPRSLYIHHNIHKHVPLNTILSQLNPVCTSISHIWKICFKIFLPSASRSLQVVYCFGYINIHRLVIDGDDNKISTNIKPWASHYRSMYGE